MEKQAPALSRTMQEGFMTCILDIGEMLLKNGAEIMRVEDTLYRLCKSCGFSSAEVFSIPSCIILTARAPGGATITQTRRVRARGTDLELVSRANDLSRKVCACPPPLEEFQAEVKALKNKKSYTPKQQLFIYCLISASFSVFFGGNALDALASAISGAVLYMAVSLGGLIRLNSILMNAFASGLTAFAVIILCAFLPGASHDKIIIGNIMLLIPRLALTTSLRDIINGDTISGLAGFCEAVIKALAIAAGSAVVLYGLGGYAI